MRTWVLPLLFLLGCPENPAAIDMARPPDLLRDGACNTEIGCRMGLCLPPSASVGCGACRTPDPGEVCQTDEQCKMRGANLICVSDSRSCVCNGERLCQAGCTQNSCPEGMACYADLRCAGKPCAADDECPAHFQCNGSKRCERRSCRTSAECDAGHCVGGACYKEPGSCTLPAA